MKEFRPDNTQDYTGSELDALNDEWNAIVQAEHLETETDEYDERLDRFQTAVAKR